MKVADGETTFKFNKTEQLVNSSFCHIAGLKVFQGRDQAIEIDHRGFSLSDNGTIEVRQRQIIWSQIMHNSLQINKDELAYSVDDFMGELYQIKLSCTGEGLPESGCFFFKVQGETNITTG